MSTKLHTCVICGNNYSGKGYTAKPIKEKGKCCPQCYMLRVDPMQKLQDFYNRSHK